MCTTKIPKLNQLKVVDLESGYWQVEMDPEDREKTAFTVGSGLCQFTVMPYGLCNAPATFEQLIESVLKGAVHGNLIGIPGSNVMVPKK